MEYRFGRGSGRSSNDTLVGTPEPLLPFADSKYKPKPAYRDARLRTTLRQKFIIWIFLFSIIGYFMYSGRRGPSPVQHPAPVSNPAPPSSPPPRWPDNYPFYEGDEDYDNDNDSYNDDQDKEGASSSIEHRRPISASTNDDDSTKPSVKSSADSTLDEMEKLEAEFEALENAKPIEKPKPKPETLEQEKLAVEKPVVEKPKSIPETIEEEKAAVVNPAQVPQPKIEQLAAAIADDKPATKEELVKEPEVPVVEAPVQEQQPEKEMSDDDRYWAEHWDILHANKWLRFDALDGYFNGLKALVTKKDFIPQYPSLDYTKDHKAPEKLKKIPKPQVYSPYNTDSKSKACYLDDNEKHPAPDMYAYDGVPQGMPDPAIGSYDLLGLRDDICFDRFSRYGPYGLGYSSADGGMNLGQDTEDAENQHVWAQSGQINWASMDWGRAQKRCAESNKDRFLQVDPATEQLEMASGKKGRSAVIIRLYTGFAWTGHTILNFRAMINELSLKSGGEYTVYFLLHVKDESLAFRADPSTAQSILDANVPREFHNMCSMWSEDEMKLYYPGQFPDAIEDMSRADIHGVYRSAHLPLQTFAVNHPEYEHFWNWEMDLRYVGNYYELFNRVGLWADKQPRHMAWERSERYYVPSYHGSWENFTKTVETNVAESGQEPVFGRVNFQENERLRFEEENILPYPENCKGAPDSAQCGVGESADFVSFNPIFNTQDSGWVFNGDMTGYGRTPPRRGVIITAARLSKRLLAAMHEEVWRYHHTMFTEMFPPSVALHHGFKAVFAPHPVFLDRAWNPPSEIDEAFNGGVFHSASGHGSPFDLWNEWKQEPSTFYFNSKFSGQLWRRWLGYAQPDNRGEHEPGVDAGGARAEKEADSTGRMCLRSTLLHPIKWEHPNE